MAGAFDPVFVTPDGEELEPFGSEDAGLAELPHRDEAALRRMHHDEGKALSTMADELGVARTTLEKQMARLGVERLGHVPERRSWEPPLDPEPDPGADSPCPDCGRGWETEAEQHECMRSHARLAAALAERDSRRWL